MRGLEWFTVGAGLVLFSGAIFPLLIGASDGVLDPTEKGLGESERALLRMLNLPVYALTLMLLARRPIALLRALRRNVPMLALLLLPMASVLWTISQSITLRRAIALMLSMGLAYLLAIRFTPRQQIQLLSAVLGGATVLSLLAAGVMPGLAFMPGDGGLRGIFMHKNVLGWVASVTVMLGLAARLDAGRAMRRSGLALIVTGSLGALLSTSATAMITAVTAVFVFLAVRMVTRRRGAARLAAKLLLLSSVTLILSALVLGLLPLLELLGKDATLTGRVPLWELARAEIAGHPLLGHGYGVFWSEANPAAWLIWEKLGWQAPHAHNGYLDLLLGTGAAGLALFVLVTIRGMQQGTELCTAEPRAGWIWCILVIGTSLAMNLTESTFLMQNDLMWTLFSAATITLSCRHAELRRSVPRHARLAHAAV